MPAPTPPYTWSDDGPAVTVRVPLPPSTSDVAVDARSGLEVSAGGAAIVEATNLVITGGQARGGDGEQQQRGPDRPVHPPSS